jgi:hypothetical protein
LDFRPTFLIGEVWESDSEPSSETFFCFSFFGMGRENQGRGGERRGLQKEQEEGWTGEVKEGALQGLFCEFQEDGGDLGLETDQEQRKRGKKKGIWGFLPVEDDFSFWVASIALSLQEELQEGILDSFL